MANLRLSFILALGCATLVLGMPRKPVNPLLTFPTPPTHQLNLTSPFPMLKSDIRFTEEQLKSGIVGENYRWRGGFYVQIDSRFNQEEYAIINNALYDIHVNLCIDVLIWPSDANPSGDYAFIERGGDGSGCWSYVGRLGGRQVINLQWNGCVYQGTAAHEAIHALGFFHEQSRPDRDDFVNILYHNIIPEYAYAFDKYSWQQVGTYDVPYDYTSIMHYNSHDFTANGQETIQAKNGSPVGSRGFMTEHDKTKLRRMYNC